MTLRHGAGENKTENKVFLAKTLFSRFVMEKRHMKMKKGCNEQ